MCLFVREDISGTTCAIFIKIVVDVSYDRGSVLLRRRCDTLWTSDFVDDIMFFNNEPFYCGINFATKNRFRLNVGLLTAKLDKIQFSITKGHTCSCDYFEITRKLK